MTFEILNKIIEENNIPKDVRLMSDSGWECDATEMDGIWYNREENTLIFTQKGDVSYYSIYDSNNYTNDPNWVCLYGKAKDFFDKNGYPMYKCLEWDCVSCTDDLCYRKDRENCEQYNGC